MPLLLHKEIENGEIGLWKITEEIDQLLHLAKLSEPDLVNYSEFSALHRKKEWLATRALLIQLIKKQVQIKYFNDGKPYLENGLPNISISHTKGFVSIMLHQTAIPGIDIEHLSRQVGKVASRFLSSEEMDLCRQREEYSNFHLLLHWCAKEAIFKMVPYSNIEFSTDMQILINDSSLVTGSFCGIFNGSVSQDYIPLNYILVDGIVMVWGILGELNHST